jgi:hypothetical protein
VSWKFPVWSIVAVHEAWDPKKPKTNCRKAPQQSADRRLFYVPLLALGFSIVGLVFGVSIDFTRILTQVNTGKKMGRKGKF